MDLHPQRREPRGLRASLPPRGAAEQLSRARALCSLLSVAALALPSRAAAQAYTGQEVRLVGRVMLTSGAGGRFADPTCDGERHVAAAPFVRHAALLATEEHRFDDALLLDTGGLLAPNGIAQFAAATDPEGLAAMIASLGYEALAFGESELGAPREGVLATLRGLRERGVPSIASNLRCADEASPLCEVVVDATDGVPILSMDAQRVAVLAFLSPSVLHRVAPENAAGIRLAPVQASMEAAVRAARARGATAVIAILGDGMGGETSARALALAARLAEDGRPDLLISAGGGDRILFARPATFRPATVGAPPGGAVDIHVRRNDVTGTYDVLAQPMEPASEVPEAVQSWIDAIGPRYCAQWGERLAGGHTGETTLDAAGLLALTAGILRERADAEIALVNRGVVDRAFRPAQSGGLTASDVFVGLQFDEPLVRARVPGSWIQEVARRSATRPELLALGITIEEANTSKEKIKINGRAFEPNGTYEVVTLRFLATGGDDLLPEGPAWEPVANTTVRSAVLEFLRQPSEEDPRERLPDFADRPEWIMHWNAMATYGGSTVNNPGDYEDSQFDWQNTAAFGVDSTTRVDALARLWGWENTFILRYQTARTGAGAFSEGNDLVSFRSHVRYRALRVRRDEIYVPDPYFEAYLETELTRNSDVAYHHLLLRPMAGFRWDLTPKLTVKVNAGYDWEVFDDSRDPSPGIGLQLVLQPLTLMESGDRRVTLELTTDYFVSNLGGLHRQSLRSISNLVFAMNRIFAMVMTANTYAVREADDVWSVASTVSAALRLGWVERRAR